jgi:hypothetical protein
MFSRALTQRLAQCANALVEIVLFDDGVGPHRGHEAVLVEQLSGAAHEIKQQVEGARRERDARAVGGEQHALRGIHAKAAGFVKLRGFGCFHVRHSVRFRTIQCVFQRPRSWRRAILGATQTLSPNELKPMNALLSSARRARFSIVIPLGILMAIIAVIGFWRTYFGALFTGQSHAEWFFHLHAAIFMGWIGLVILQSYLAITGRTALHVKIGKFGMAYGAALVVFGLSLSLFLFARKVALVGPAGTRGGFLTPLTDMLTFALFLGGAWFYRKRPEFHRRFILLAANGIIIAAVGRIFGGTTSVAIGDVIPFLLVWLSPCGSRWPMTGSGIGSCIRYTHSAP